MAEIAETSRIEALDNDIFRRLRGQELLLTGPEFEEILEAAPALSVPEISELDLRLRADGFLSPGDSNRSLAMMAVHARAHEDPETVKNLRKYFLKRFNLIGAGLVYLEERTFRY
jgi:hypothetical protein